MQHIFEQFNAYTDNPNDVYKRGGLGLIGGTTLVFLLRPGNAFYVDEKGEIQSRPWKVVAPDNPAATSTPWFFWAIAGGIIGSVFV